MNVVIVGCGRLGSGLARSLSLAGHTVAVIDPAPDALQRLGSGFLGNRIQGDAMDREVLRSAGIQHADALAATTTSDDINAAIGRLASRVLGVPRVVARVHDPQRAAVFRHIGVHCVSPESWGVERMSELLLLSDLEPVASLGAGQVEILDAVVPQLLSGRPLSELQLAGEVRVTAITRDGTTFVPPSDEVALRAHDVVHLAVAASSASRVAALLGRGRS